MKKVLIVVDMQNDFINGALGSPYAEAIVPNVIEKIKNFETKDIIVTYDTHYENYLETQEGKLLPIKHCIDETKGWKLPSKIYNAISEKIETPCIKYVKKDTFGSYELAKYLAVQNDNEKIEEITLIGLCTDICVISNVMLLKAYLPETKIIVDASCCAGVTPESHKNALNAMKSCQIFIENE